MKETSNIKIFFLSSLRPKSASLVAQPVMQPSACNVGDLGSIPDPWFLSVSIYMKRKKEKWVSRGFIVIVQSYERENGID